ncbi:MAG: flagellar basal body rod protein FlgB [Dorea sp.]|nr:flagellar basal body rod protein FlgB [Dorea sp.]
MNHIFGNGILVSEKSLDFLWKKQSVSAGNLANVDTPGYKAKYVTFEDMYRAKLKGASGDGAAVRRAADSAVWQIEESDTETARMDGNNVVADAELSEMTKSALQYQFTIQSVNNEISRLASVIKG